MAFAPSITVGWLHHGQKMLAGQISSFVPIRVHSWLSLFVRFRYFRLFRHLSAETTNLQSQIEHPQSNEAHHSR
jgi:hypothetical protein